MRSNVPLFSTFAARAMGGASLPLLANFTQDREVLFKDNA